MLMGPRTESERTVPVELRTAERASERAPGSERNNFVWVERPLVPGPVQSSFVGVEKPAVQELEPVQNNFAVLQRLAVQEPGLMGPAETQTAEKGQGLEPGPELKPVDD